MGIIFFVPASDMGHVCRKICAIFGLCVWGFVGATVARGTLVYIHPNADGTVGTAETSKYKNVKNLNVKLIPGTKCIGTGAFKGWDNLLSVICKESNGGDGVTIGVAAFKGCSNLSAVSFSKTGDIGMCAFEGCRSLTMLDVSHSENIFRSAFKNCTSLAKLYVCKDAYWADRTGALEGCPNVRVFEREP